MSEADIRKDLTCSRCHEVQETYSEIVYSQGYKVCLECKKGSQRGDNWSFDIYMNSRIIRGFQ